MRPFSVLFTSFCIPRVENHSLSFTRFAPLFATFYPPRICSENCLPRRVNDLCARVGKGPRQPCSATRAPSHPFDPLGYSSLNGMNAASDSEPGSTPTDEGAAACADFTGWIGRDDFDPAWSPANRDTCPRLPHNRHKSLSCMGLASQLSNVNRLANVGTTDTDGRKRKDCAALDGQPGCDGPVDPAVYQG